MRLLEGMAGAHTASGSFTRGTRRCARASSCAPWTPVPERVRLIAALASLENLIGRHQDAHGRLAAALDELPDRTSEAAVALMTELGIDAFFRMDYAAMRDFSRRALEAARALGDKQLMSTPAGVLAFADVLDGALTEADAEHRRGRGARRRHVRRRARPLPARHEQPGLRRVLLGPI